MIDDGAWTADCHTQQGELFVTTGNLPALRNLLERWAGNPNCCHDDRLARFRARLQEMEEIEKLHGLSSLTIFISTTPRKSAAKIDEERFAARVARAVALLDLKGQEWWSWAHRPCMS